MAQTVAAVMTGGVPAVDERAGVALVVDVVERGGPALPEAGVAVLDPLGRLLGAIEPAEHPDLFAGPGLPGGAVRVAGTLRQRRRRAERAAATAHDLMSPALAVPATWPVSRALRLFGAHGTDRGFVVDDLGRVLGTITSRQCRWAPAAVPASKEANRDQVRV